MHPYTPTDGPNANCDERKIDKVVTYNLKKQLTPILGHFGSSILHLPRSLFSVTRFGIKSSPIFAQKWRK